MNTCPICSAEQSRPEFTAQLLGKYEVSYFLCPDCGLLQTEKPYWLDEAYGEAIAVADTGLVMRNLSLATRLAGLLYIGFDRNAAFLDVAGGYGLLTRLMRDFGFDYYWDDKYCNNLLARGFEADKSSRPFAALTAFEVIEHVHDPIAFIQEEMTRYGCQTLIFTTELFEGPEPPPKDWWYYAFSTGQHVSFYQRKTLQKIADCLSLNFQSVHGLHILSKQKLTLGPLAWFSTSKLSPLFALLARRRLGSRTFRDHLMLVEHSRSSETM